MTQAGAEDPIANVARGWRRRATAASAPSPHFGVSAAMWVETGDGPYEVAAGANQDTHVLAVTTTALRAEVFIDRRPVFSGIAPPGACNLVQPGQSPRGVFYEPWRLLHIYLPGSLLRQVADEEGLPANAGELVNPMWTVQPPLRSIAHDVVAAKGNNCGSS